ncbi:protein kinase [Colletotrichum tofieldiae]|nr:protein kinase [Colletotrichum tofieldiae]GKT86047.1 protein kinase [Colletotrichum tofieldiae]
MGLFQGGKLILDDNQRVSKIYDRGESVRFDKALDHHNLRTNGKPAKSDVPLSEQNFIGDIAAELDEAKVSYIIEPDKKFIPHIQFRKILTFDRVRLAVQVLTCFSGQKDKDKLAREIYYGSHDEKKGPCLKLLAVLIGIDVPNDMAKHMLTDGMSDTCLPLEKETGDGPQYLRCRKHGRHHTINQYRRPDVRERFAQWSYSLSAPYIARQGSLHSHYMLDTGDVFPMEVEYKVEQDNTESTAKGSQGDGNTYGGFSEVYKVKIHDGHFYFGDHGIRHPRGFFALKKLTSHNRLSFNLELSSLIFTGHQYSKKHLIQLLATFEVANLGTGTSTFYLLFDWAEGSLNKFWENNKGLVGDKNHCKWMATQFYEISEALQCVHNDRAPTLRYLEDRASNEELYGRHGDIKPGLIALSDFGLGRLHTQVSRSKQDPKNIERTATYRSPEFDLPFGKVSPRSDIFSLGCVMLEYVTWFLMGLDAVEKVFPDARSERDIYGFDSDVFFSIKNEKAFLKPSVAKWIQELQNHQNCSWYIWDLLEIIKDRMLDPNGETRIPANQLTKRMKALQAVCLSESEYYLGVRAKT